MLTEEAARMKWCPLARQVGGIVEDFDNGKIGHAATYGAVFNRAEGSGAKAIWPSGARCIASDCMAWRSAFRTYQVNGDHMTETVAKGWCGLAGTTVTP